MKPSFSSQNYRLSLLLCILTMSMAALFSFSDALATDWVVNTLADISDGNCTDGNCSLRDAIDLSGSGDNITFDIPDGGSMFLNSTLNISHSLQISGPETKTITLDGHDEIQIMLASGAGDITISNLTFSNGSMMILGGAGILNTGSLSLNNTTFQYCNGLNGGAIYSSSNSSLSVTNSTFYANQANELGGAIYAAGNSAAITNTVVTGNYALSGGGLYLSTSNPAEISSCEISNNNTNENGGGIYTALETNILNTTISGNIATGYGGGVYAEFASPYTDISFSTITDNTTQAEGGGLFNDGPLRLKNTIVSDNKTAGTSAHFPDISGSPVKYEGCVLVSDMGGASMNLFPGSTGTLLMGKSAKLGPLADNGGPARTHALLSGSPALNKVEDFTTLDGDAVSDDQRGEPRPQGGSKGDLGAYESSLSCYIPAINSLVLQ